VNWPEVWQSAQQYAQDTLLTLLQLGSAAILAGIVGWERESADKPAGFRTFMLVGLGSAAFTLLTMRLYEQVNAGGGEFGADPIRIISGVIGGLGFLGAGTIIQAGSTVRGITTAATIWVTGSIGVACGLQFYGTAVATVILSYGILRLGLLAELKHAESVKTKSRSEHER
jgi:putative Mg2+ transporter-C (MgtC) family protein